MLKELFSNIKRVYRYSYGCRKYIITYLITSVLIMISGIVVPILVSLQLVGLTDGLWDKVIIYSLFVFGLGLLHSLLDFISSESSSKFSKIIVAKIQLELGSEILQLELSDIDKHSNGVFIQRLTRDANDVSSIFTYGVNIINNVIKEVGITIVIFFINFWIGLFYLIYIVVYILIQKQEVKKLDEKDIELRNQREGTTGFSTEIIRGIRDIKMLNAEKSFVKKIEEKVLNLNDRIYNLAYVRNKFIVIKNSLSDLFELGLIVLIVYFIKNNYFDIALGLVIYNYRRYITGLVYSIDGLLNYVREFNMACMRVFSLLGGSEFKKEKFGRKHLNIVTGDFSFEDVYFSYEDNEVLKGLSFDVKANEVVGFVGKSGSGKTTIFNLLCKFYDIDKGSIKIDGIDIKKLDKDTIRGNITVINQSPYIFNMSIRDNLKLIKEDLTDEEMIKACRLACLDDYIESLPDKYDTIVGEGGVNLSGGQRQRLAIARALVQKTEIILFDEATSALDNETQSKIQKSIENMRNEYTILIVAHRLSTIINCDRILFIDNGKVLCEGSHQYLLNNCKEYKKLYESEIIND